MAGSFLTVTSAVEFPGGDAEIVRFVNAYSEYLAKHQTFVGFCFDCEATSTVREMVTTGSMYIRSGPGTTYPQVGTIVAKSTVSVLKTEGNWAFIGAGWVSMAYLRPK